MTYDPAIENTLPPGAHRFMRDVDPTIAVVVARLDDLRVDVKGLREELRASTANVVGRGEWMQRNALVDGKFDSHGREIGQLRQDYTASIAATRAEHASDVAAIRADLASRRAPWWSIMAAIGSAVAIAAVIIPALAR